MQPQPTEGEYMLSIIAAMSKNRVIGKKGDMPWHLPKELAYFKKITRDSTIIMGRKTFDSIGYALPERRNIVLTRNANWSAQDCDHYSNLASALNTTDTTQNNFIIGGAHLFNEALPLADRLYLTVIDTELEGDTYFPQWDASEWELINSTSTPIDDAHQYAFTAMVYQRKNQTYN